MSAGQPIQWWNTWSLAEIGKLAQLLNGGASKVDVYRAMDPRSIWEIDDKAARLIQHGHANYRADFARRAA